MVELLLFDLVENHEKENSEELGTNHIIFYYDCNKKLLSLSSY